MKRTDPKKLKAIAELIERGETNKAIAAKVSCSASTVTKVRKELAAGAVADDDDSAAFTGGGDDGPIDGWEEKAPPVADNDDDGMSLVPTDYVRALEAVVYLVEENQRLRSEVANG